MLPQEVLKQYFGYDQFRTGQEQLINAILAGRDVMGVMPTGAGKSICFQLPAMMLEGVTLVISPLISLMKDQVNALTQEGIAAAYINSSLNERQVSLVMERAQADAYKLIYVAPERLLTADFVRLAQSIQIAMLTVDEAHCISQWGQDFRPSYAKIPEFLSLLDERPIVSAFTATATPKVRTDIMCLLELQEPEFLVTGFDRKNLYFEVKKPQNRFGALLSFLEKRKGKSGIIYCSTRANVEKLCDKLNEEGYPTSRYHAGLSDTERANNQDDFLFDRVQIMTATNAFGMGIDKSNVSFVVHFNMPKDLESYYQEAGRAGRDGSEADCLLLYNGQDIRTNLWMIENGRDVENQDPEMEKLLKERDKGRLREMINYCESTDCLRAQILRYFGETETTDCDNCGNCGGDFDVEDITVDAQKILSCVVRMGERFGVSMVIDVLRGSENEKVKGFGFQNLSTYGICKNPARELREMLDCLLQNGYLVKTEGEYPILKCGAAARLVLQGQQQVLMKRKKDARRYQQEEVRTIKPVDQGLLGDLKELRLSLAREQQVPAYVVFTDSSLTEMAMYCPQNEVALLKISGVGKAKLERYGEQFLQVLRNYQPEIPMETAEQEPTETAETGEPDFQGLEASDEIVTVKLIADQISCALVAKGLKRVTGQRVNDWMVSVGWLKIVPDGSRTRKIPTDLGKSKGIIEGVRTYQGIDSTINLFTKEAQAEIYACGMEILEFVQAEKVERKRK